MEHKDPQECIRSLAMMAETDSFLISCYLNLKTASIDFRILRLLKHEGSNYFANMR